MTVMSFVKLFQGEVSHKNIGGIIGKVADLANKAPTIGGFFGAVKK